MNYVLGILVGGEADGRRVQMLDVPHLTVVAGMRVHHAAPGHEAIVPTTHQSLDYRVFWGCEGTRFLRPSHWTETQAFQQLARNYALEIVK